MRVYVVIFLSMIGMLSSWKVLTINGISNVYINADNKEKAKEKNFMKREFCEVMEEEEDFILKNTKGELYRLDSSLKEKLKKGDNVLLIYTERHQIEADIYEADVYAIYSNSLELQMLAK